MTWKIPLFETYWDEKDIDAVSNVIKRGTYWATGPEIQEFEKRIANFVGVKYALAFNSGTSALHTLLLAYDIKDKEVIVPSFTFIATSNAVLLAGGIPVFAEAEDDTYGLDIEDVKSKINNNTKMIIDIAYGGFPPKNTLELRKLADDKNLIYIEDSAESLGSHINKKMVGSIGHSAIFSFCQNKILAIGEGGMLLTNSEEIYQKAILLRSHGRVEEANDYFSHTGDNDYIQVGYNYRMPTMGAALGLSQFDKIEKVIELRRSYSQKLSLALKDINEIKVPVEIEGHFQVYQMYTIQLPNKEIRDSLQRYLESNGIMSKVYFNPVHLKTVYRSYGYKEGDLPKTELLSTKVLTLPMFPTMNEEQLLYLIKTIRGFFKNERFKQNNN